MNWIYNLFSKKKIDDFDKSFGFMLKYNIVSQQSYFSVKSHWLQYYHTSESYKNLK